MDDLRYPIGQFDYGYDISQEQVERWIDDIEALPAQLRKAVAGLDEAQLDTPYRPQGWTVRQVVHHVGDSHLNSFVRFKLALTEDNPTIKTYYENRWAELADYRSVAVETSLDFITHLHTRWVALLRSLDETQLSRTFLHPEIGTVKLAWNIGLYARHHVAHDTRLREREGWI
ncbi:putative metal-dependent hydrolase [bacterium]|nr:putative metal-dependent hydrolase [bacterium]